LCVLLAAIHASGQSTELAQSGIDLLGKIVGWIPEAHRQQTLLLEDVADLVWSVLLASGALGAPKSEISAAARRIRHAIGDVASGDLYLSDYDVPFILGLLVLRGEDDAAVAREAEVLRSVEPERMGWGRSNGLGVAPRVNRNATAHYVDAVASVETWAGTMYKQLRS
jgi:hypothetical protein